MRVAHVIPDLARRSGGPPVFVAEAARALARAGVASTILTTDLSGPRALTRIEPGDVVAAAAGLDVRVFAARAPRRFASSPSLARALARIDVDLVHVHMLHLFPTLAGGLIARRRGLPYVISPHGALDPYIRARSRLRKAVVDVVAQRRVLERAAALHVTTAEEAELLADVAPEVPRFVAPPGIDAAAFAGDKRAAAAGFRRTLLGGSADPVIVNVGRLAEKKGLDVLIDAFARLPDAPRPWLVLVGPDEAGQRELLQRRAAALGVADRLVLPGPLYGDDKLGALAAASVWALPSRSENFGIAVIEALAAGCPTIVSPHVNLAPALAADAAARVVPLQADALAAELAALLADAPARRQLSARGVSFARRYDWAAVVAPLADGYRAALARSRARRSVPA